MTKFLRRTKMLRFKLKNNFNKKRSDEIGITIRSKEIFGLNYSARPKKYILLILMLKLFLTKRNFRKKFSDKCLSTSNIMLLENNEIVREEEGIVSMNNYFTYITTHIKLKPTKIDPKVNLKSITNTFQNHESAQGIKLANFHSTCSLKSDSVSEF